MSRKDDLGTAAFRVLFADGAAAVRYDGGQFDGLCKGVASKLGEPCISDDDRLLLSEFMRELFIQPHRELGDMVLDSLCRIEGGQFVFDAGTTAGDPISIPLDHCQGDSHVLLWVIRLLRKPWITTAILDRFIWLAMNHDMPRKLVRE